MTSTATRLGAYGAALAVVFAGAYVAADAVVPQRMVTTWTEKSEGHEMSTTSTSTSSHASVGTHDGHSAASRSGDAAPIAGVTSAQGGYRLAPVSAPSAVGEPGTLSLRILDARGEAVTDYDRTHERDLHLVVVRSDGSLFRHVHPTMAADGTWSLPWEWAAAGSYRVYADFAPRAGSGTLTLTRTVEVAGSFAPVPTAPRVVASVDGFTVELTGELVARSASHLTFTISRDGRPVTTVQPYLGAFGHLVALREGDLAFLHVHPEGDEPAAEALSGPEIEFAAEAPTPGRYLLYLDFRVDGAVHSASFVVGAAPHDH